MKKKNLPESIANYAVTYKCNSRCKNCNIWKINDQSKKELDIEEITNFFENNLSMLYRINSIQLTGGEPFLRSDLTEIILKIHNFLPKCSFWIPTNGQESDLIIETLESVFCKAPEINLGISVSIDGSLFTHDSLRGLKGSYMKVLQTLDVLNNFRKNKHFKISIGTTISSENYLEIPEIFEIVKKNNFDFSFRVVHESSFYYHNKINHSNLSGKKIKPYVDQSIHWSIQRKGLIKSLPTIAYFNGLLKFLDEGERINCSAGSSSFFMNPYGDIYPCIFFDRFLGNIREKSLKEIWNSEIANQTRLEIKKLNCGKCWIECESFREIRKNKLSLIQALFSQFV
ncbi:radical SAM protein [Candidatus Bathyarchaeota archaeon]|nr:radical SAM protein [Candidatus Bathyarchaeota archaeon]